MRLSVLACEVIATIALSTLLGACGNSKQDGANVALFPQAATTEIKLPTRVYANGLFVETDQASVPAQVYRLYRAAFAREADTSGLGFHVGFMEVYGHSLADVAANF